MYCPVSPHYLYQVCFAKDAFTYAGLYMLLIAVISRPFTPYSVKYLHNLYLGFESKAFCKSIKSLYSLTWNSELFPLFFEFQMSCQSFLCSSGNHVATPWVVVLLSLLLFFLTSFRILGQHGLSGRFPYNSHIFPGSPFLCFPQATSCRAWFTILYSQRGVWH